MKHILTIILILFSFLAYSQAGYKSSRNYAPNMTVQDYVQFSPGNTFATSRLVAEYRDSLYYRILYKSVRIDYLGSSTDVYLRTDNLGNLFKSPITDIFNPALYYDKTQSDARYLQTFNEIDPVFFGSPSFGITAPLITNWNTAFSWGNHASVGYATAVNTMTFTNKSGNISQWTNNVGYLTSEVDGSVVNEGSISVGSGSSTSSTINSNTSESATVTIESGQGIIITEAGNTITVSDSKKQETFSGTTSGSGTYTVSFGVAYSVEPNVQVACTNCTDTQSARITSITTTGFTVQGRNEALGLIFSNANGLTVDVLITEK